MLVLGAQALSALNIYDWMRARVKEGGAGLSPTVFTYTAAMRAALSAGLVDRALLVSPRDLGMHTYCTY